LHLSPHCDNNDDGWNIFTKKRAQYLHSLLGKLNINGLRMVLELVVKIPQFVVSLHLSDQE
jgi:hypothetical protein